MSWGQRLLKTICKLARSSRFISTIALMCIVFLAFPTHLLPIAKGAGAVLDDYNYNSADPDTSIWDASTMVQECDPGTTVCHDMSVANPPGYLFSDNQACKPGWDPSSTHSGCGRDARMQSANTPLRLDNATAQRLWMRKSDGSVGWFSVTQLKVGDYLFNVLGQRWAQVLDISYVKGGIHTMYDIYNTSPFDYIANGYLDPQKN